MAPRASARTIDLSTRGKATNLDLLEVKIRQLLKQISDANLEIARLQQVAQPLISGEVVAAKDREVEEKNAVIRRQQALIKSKDTSFQELQDAYHLLRKENESLKNAPPPAGLSLAETPVDEESRQRMRERLETVLEKLNQLEELF